MELDLSTLKGANLYLETRKNRGKIGDLCKNLATKGICFQKCKGKFVQVYVFHRGIVTESDIVPYLMWDTHEGQVITKGDKSYVCAYNLDWANKYFGM